MAERLLFTWNFPDFPILDLVEFLRNTSKRENLKSLTKHVGLMISIIFFSQTLLQGGEMTVMDSEVIETQQVFEEIVLKAVSKGNLQGNKVVGILKPEIPDNVQNPRYLPVMDNALQLILAAHTRLADRSILVAMDEEQALMLKKGEASFAGVRTGVLAEIDYFAWASFSTIGRLKTIVRVTVADAKTGVVRSMASKTLQLPMELQLSEQTNPQEFHGWKEEWEESNEVLGFSRNVFWMGVALLTVGVIAAPCEEKSYKDDRNYDNFIECNRQEAGRIYSSSMFVGGISFAFGGITMLLEKSSLAGLEQERKSKNYPALSFRHQQGRSDIQWIFRF